MRLGATELLLILAVVILLWGPSKLPELGRALGRGIHDFRRELHGTSEGQPVPPGTSRDDNSLPPR